MIPWKRCWRVRNRSTQKPSETVSDRSEPFRTASKMILTDGFKNPVRQIENHLNYFRSQKGQ